MIDQRISYRYGGDTMGGRNDRSTSPSRGPAGGASRGGNYGGNVNASQSSFGGGDRDRPAPSSVPSTDRMDIREQARLGNINPNQDNFVTIQGIDRRAIGPGSDYNVTRNMLDQFTSYRPEVNIPNFPGVLSLLGNLFKGGIQKFSDISAAENRGFFGDPNYKFSPFGIDLGRFGEKKNVIQAGKYQLPGELGVKYGKLGYEDISNMSKEELEQAYQSYMSARMSGEIDAYGNPLMRGDGENPLQNLLLAQQQAAIANPLGTEETPQGGVAAYYNQYLKNLGYIL